MTLTLTLAYAGAAGAGSGADAAIDSRPPEGAGVGGGVGVGAGGVNDIGTARVKAACLSLTCTSDHNAVYTLAPSLHGAYAGSGARRKLIRSISLR